MQLGSNPPVFNLEAAATARERDAHPDLTPKMWRGIEFTKTLPLRCPWCRNVFYIWQAVGGETEPYNDPTAIQTPGKGQRYTCGHPICWEREQNWQVKQSEDFKKTQEAYYSAKEITGKTFQPQRNLTPLAKIR